ncbi:uncharacterized protein LOC135836095 [Planococcus citri]|uniref:uncharacterized protein LOC135836095 n=1 Tax=Planococcus citri TaxID=170843 RepID=UPI0031F753AC
MPSMPSFTPRNANRNGTDDINTEKNQNSSSFFLVIVIIIVVVLLMIIIMSVIKWFIKERRLRELRHRLIPLYTFDPNDEDDWESELLNPDQSDISQKSQDYNSISTNEDNDSLMNRLR